MSPTDFVIRAVCAWALCAAAVAAVAAAPAPAAPKPAPRAAATGFDAAEYALQQRLETPEAARVFREYNAAHALQIQHNLAVVYAKDADYVADAGGPGRPLGDSIVGPVTLKWLRRFCRDYGIVATEPGFAQDVVQSLEQVAGIARAHPDWKAILDSADFEAWIDGQPTAARVQSLKMRRSGAAAQVNALIAQYLRSRRPATAKPADTAPLAQTYSYDPKRPAPGDDPAAIAARLRPLAKRPAEDERLFEADVRDALQGMSVSDDTLALIKRYAATDGYLVGSELLAGLARDGMPQGAVADLQKAMEGIEFDSAQAFEDALAVAAEASTDPAAFQRYQLAIVRGARVTRYQVPGTLATDMAGTAVLPPPIAQLLAFFRNVEYPTPLLFDRALEWQVRRGLGMCPDPGRQEGVLKDDQVVLLKTVLAGDAVERIVRLRQRTDGCDANEQVEADNLAYQAYRDVAVHLDRAHTLYARHAMPAGTARDVSWAVPDCRCGRDERDGIVFGFHPLWTDGTHRRINFNGLTRLALYGLTANATGALYGPPGMTGVAIPADIAALARDAHRHNVRVDWVVARSDWSAWRRQDADGKTAMLAKLTDNIVALLDRPLRRDGQLAARIASLGADPGPTGGDGVVLYFRHFPAADTALYNGFVEKLTQRLNALHPARRVSLVVDYDELGQNGPFGYHNLIDLIRKTNPKPNGMTFAAGKLLMLADLPVLVMLPEPTRDTKKALRGAIQDALRGTDSARLIRAMVPVLEYDGTGAQQLADDIVYVADNYFGIGFWPLPYAADDGTEPGGDRSVNQLLLKFFQPNDDVTPGGHWIAATICPQRLWLRWAFWIALAAALGIGAYYFSCRGCNERLDNSALYFGGMMALLALPLVILAVLAIGDPLLDPYRYVLLGLYGTGGLVVAGLVARYYFNRSRRRLP